MRFMMTGQRDTAYGQRKPTVLSQIGRLFIFMMGIAFLVAIAGSQQARADTLDQLYLTGTIKSINSTTGIVYIEVVSSSCSGMRMFRADRLDIVEDYIDKKVSFFIDSSTCADTAVHTMLVARGLRR